jgi:C1A family cysteine protease
VISKYRQKPPKKCYDEARKHKITAYHRLKTLTEMRICLAQGYPILCGISLYESFISKRVARTGILELPRKDEAVIGGHAVLLIGYEDARKRFIIRNSWGTKWGQEGYFTAPYAYLENRHYSSDFWTIHRASNF